MGLQGLSSRAIIGAFYEVLEQSVGANWTNLVSMPFDSDQESETYKWLSATPVVREWIGERLAKGLRDNGITITNKKYEATLEIPVDWLRRDKTSQIMIRIGEMADRVAAHWASLLSTLINNGAGSTSGLAYDGQLFFDTDHIDYAGAASSTQSNDITNTDYGQLAVVDKDNPTASEMADVIMKMVQHFYTLKDDVGEPINEMAKNFLVMVPVSLWGATQTAVASNLLNTGSGARDNPLRGLDGLSLTVAANARLTGTDTAYMFRTDGRTKPFIAQSEVPLQINAIAEGSELEFNNDVHHYGVKLQRNVGFGMWQHALLATLTTA